MRILLTNDDGIESEGLLKLQDELAGAHEVWIVAPEKERSGSSHAISIFTPVRVREKSKRVFACDGTPADCVLLGIRALILPEVDAVIAGINRGPNLGTDILYSGTVCAARQGALMGKPSFAFSLLGEGGIFSFEDPVRFVAEMLPSFVDLWEGDHFLNVNFPPRHGRGYVPAVTFPSQRIYRDRYESFEAPDKSRFFFLQGEGTGSLEEDGGDFCAVMKGFVSISPLAVQPANHEKEALYKKYLAEKERSRP